MANENPKPAESPTAPQKQRSKVERAIVWTVIGILVVVTGMEALARTGYARTLKDFEAAMDDPKEPLTLDHFQKNLKSGLAIQTTGEHEGASTILFRWPSVLKKYELHLTVAPHDQQTLATYATNEGPAGAVAQPRGEGEDSEIMDQDAPPMGMGPSMAHEQAGGPPQGQGGGGPGGRGQGGRGPGGRNPLQQLVSEPIAAELNLTDEQKTQIEALIESQPAPSRDASAEERAEQQESQRKDAMQKLKVVLDEEQSTRARQILLHARGAEALTDEEVAEELKLSEEQREQIAAIIADSREKRQALIQEQNFQAISALREETKAEAFAVLTDEQRQAWEALLGPAPPQPERGNRPGRPE